MPVYWHFIRVSKTEIITFFNKKAGLFYRLYSCKKMIVKQNLVIGLNYRSVILRIV